MQSIGGLLVLFGIGSAVLPMFGLQFSLVGWIDNWGPTIGWGIRIAMIVVGAILLLKGNSETESIE